MHSPVDIDLDERRIRLKENVQFKPTTAQYVDAGKAQEQLKQVATALSICNKIFKSEGKPLLRLSIEGHTHSPNDPNDHKMMQLSDARAAVCRESAIATYKGLNVDETEAMINVLFIAKGFGGTVPIEGYRMRAEMHVLAEGETRPWETKS